MKKKLRKELPDLAPIMYRLGEVCGLMRCAYKVVLNDRDDQGESALLGVALRKLCRAYDKLDSAEAQLSRLRRGKS